MSDGMNEAWLRGKLLEANQRTNAVVHERDVLQRRLDALENRKSVVVADIGAKCDGCGHLIGLVGVGSDARWSRGDGFPSFNLAIAIDGIVSGLGWTRIGDKHTCPACQGK